MTRFVNAAAMFILVSSSCTSGNDARADDRETRDMQKTDFSRDVLPILSDKCLHCHGPDEDSREADLRLDLIEHVLAKRDGRQIVAPGKPNQSKLVRRITSADPDERMPPRDQTRQLSASEVDTLIRWVEDGAQWTMHWAFQSPKRTSLPEGVGVSWSQNPIDRFVFARLSREHLQPANAAQKTTLTRRVTLDLNGLPPTPTEVDIFLADHSPDAYDRLVNRLLASPRYGEHMARAWLDAARYADTDGYQNDRIRYMWVWRDWLIHALNENMSFGQFTIEQLAGDLIPDASLYQQIATGFCRNHRINSEGGSIPEEWHVEYVVDRVDTLGTVWLGLTIGCARCHDHKYDPISQKEYYGLFAYFNNVAEWGLGANNGNSPPFIEVPESWPHLSDAENRAIVPDPYELITTQTSVVRPQPGGPKTVMVMHELDQPRATHLLQRGQYNQPDKSLQVEPTVPASLGLISSPASNDRMALAQWLADPSNPLTARVIVNRYWQSFFGTGIVKTSENFGIQGETPSHPDLLDWLATEFVRCDWDVKAMQRLMVTSATYLQSSAAYPQSQIRNLQSTDPENRLLARGPRMRLSAQVVRDQALAISGLLVEQIGGPSVKPYMPPGIWRSISNNKYTQDHGEKLYRRSLYTYWRRTVPPPTMMNFNSAEREVCIVRKPQTNSPLQALTLMNNVVFVESARMLAERILREGGGTIDEQITYGFRLATGRIPTHDEMKLLRVAQNTFQKRFSGDRWSAEELLTVGECPHDQTMDAKELATMTMVASTIMNLDETITKE